MADGLEEGALEGVGALLAVLLASTAVCAVLSDRRWSGPTLLVALAATQAAVHLALWLSPAGTGAHGATVSAAPPSGSTMLAAHAVALVGTALVLRFGEDVLWKLVALLRPALVVAFVGGIVTATAPLLRATRPVARLRDLVLLDEVLQRRGPPLPTTA